MSLSPEAIWIVVIGCLVGISCSLVGVFLVLRRLSMLGDAISHSVLFGIVVAFLISNSRSPLIMFIGAVLTGLFTAWMTATLNRKGKLKEDASIGVTFTWLFALGVVLISAFAGSVDLDQECVLYGELAFTPFATLSLFGRDIGPRAFWMLSVSTIMNLAFVIWGFRRLKILCFDEQMARSLGINVNFWHYTLMALVSIAVVAAFEAVGAILVVAMLVVPALTAYLLARSLFTMLIISCLVSVVATIFGYGVATRFDASIAASIALVTGALFFIVLGLSFLKRKKVIAI